MGAGCIIYVGRAEAEERRISCHVHMSHSRQMIHRNWGKTTNQFSSKLITVPRGVRILPFAEENRDVFREHLL